MCILDDMSIDFIDDWTIEDEGTTPDIRGLVLGESFYWFLDFKIKEPRRF